MSTATAPADLNHARAELERIAADEMARPEDVHDYLDVARYLGGTTGHVDKDAVIRDLAWVISERPGLCKYGMGSGQIGPDPARQPSTGILFRAGALSQTDRAELLRWAFRPDAPCVQTENGMVETAPFPDDEWRRRIAAVVPDVAAEIGTETPTRAAASIKVYPPGTGLPWHADDIGTDPQAMALAGMRRITLASSLLLNDDFTGGEFAFRDREPVHLEAGDYVAFGGEEWHRVWTVLSGLRLCLVVIAGIGVGPRPNDPRVVDL